MIAPDDPIVAQAGAGAAAIRIGDYLDWLRPVFSGGSFFRGRSTGRPRLVGYERLRGIVVRHSYGRETGQHTFSVACPAQSRRLVLVKGRNLYPNLLRHVPNLASPDRQGEQ